MAPALGWEIRKFNIFTNIEIYIQYVPFKTRFQPASPAPVKHTGGSIVDVPSGIAGVRKLSVAMNAIMEEALWAYGYVALWISLSAGVIMYNKYVLAFFGFPFPVRSRRPWALHPNPCKPVLYLLMP